MTRIAELRAASSCRGFTLIELLTVMVVIAILAGIVLSTAGYVQRKGARARTEGEIKTMETACEAYKADNGAYPRSAATDALDPRVDMKAGPKHEAATKFLYGALSKHMVFNPTQVSSTPAGSVNYLLDPFGSSYGYSTANQKWVEDDRKEGEEKGYNPTFDLWSTTGSSDPAKWIKNW